MKARRALAAFLGAWGVFLWLSPPAAGAQPRPRSTSLSVSTSIASSQTTLLRLQRGIRSHRTLKENMLIVESGPPPVKFREPADLIELVPILRDINRMIPREFSLADHDVRLINDRIIVEHSYMDEPTRQAAKNSVITFSYFGGWGPEVRTSLDVPLFYSSDALFFRSGWVRYPMGNYTMTINRSSIFNSEERVYIRAQTRF